MLLRLIARNEPLQRLRDEGYELALSPSHNHLLVGHVPYVNSRKEVAYGTLVAVLTLNGDVLAPPPDHVMHFIGDQPCNAQGIEISAIKNPSPPQDLDRGLRVDRTFSAKPPEPYKDYWEKFTKYVAMLSGPARVLDPSATATSFPPYVLGPDESVFQYADTASSRAGISAVTAKLEVGPVAIVGLGGTGSFVLDFIAKTPVSAIHLFDADVFSSHNAFRAPGAPSLEDLRNRPSKVSYLKTIYERQRRGIIAHELNLDAENAGALDEMAFVFLCMDGGPAKKGIIERLIARGIPFVDVGMGLNLVDGQLRGTLRSTLSTKDYNAHVFVRVPFSDGGVNNEYGHNIQVAELNALNAALAVIKWKKWAGFYADDSKEHSSFYGVAQNSLLNEDRP